MSNFDSQCSHSHIKFDIHICQTIVTHHVITHILNIIYLKVKPLCFPMQSHTY